MIAAAIAILVVAASVEWIASAVMETMAAAVVDQVVFVVIVAAAGKPEFVGEAHGTTVVSVVVVGWNSNQFD